MKALNEQIERKAFDKANEKVIEAKTEKEFQPLVEIFDVDNYKGYNKVAMPSLENPNVRNNTTACCSCILFFMIIL